MKTEDIYNLLKSHATELVDGKYRFKKVDLMEASKEIASQFKTVEEPLRNLLALLHRDGGHYVVKHGLERAINDAAKLIHKEWILAELNTMDNRTKLLKEIVDTDQEHGMYGNEMEKHECTNIEVSRGWGNEECFRCKYCGKTW